MRAVMNCNTFKQATVCRNISGARLVSSFSKKKDVPTPFPTKYHPTRSANNSNIQLPAGVVHNPPSAAPSPFQTPAAFLPANDPRRQVVWNQAQKDLQEGRINIENMPALSSETHKKEYHLTAEDVAKIQKLRLEDPEKWTRKALAAEFKCSPFFISMVSKPDAGRMEEMNKRLETIKGEWTQHRKDSRRDRSRRREFWLKDI